MTLGQEFSTYAVMLGRTRAALAGGGEPDPRDQPGRHRHRHRHQRAPGLRRARDAPPAEITGVDSWSSPNLIEATQDCGRLRAALRRAQARRGEAVQDLQRPAPALLGPARRAWTKSTCRRCRPARRSCRARSIPVIPEVVNQIAFEVIGNDVTVTMAAEAGQLQLNAFEPIIAHSLFKSIAHLPPAAARWRALRARHHRQPRTLRGGCWTTPSARHRAQPLHRLRALQRDRQGGARHRQAASTTWCWRRSCMTQRAPRRHAAARSADAAAFQHRAPAENRIPSRWTKSANGRWRTTTSARRISGGARATTTCARTWTRCFRRFNRAPPFAILDFGCGPGRDLKAFKDLGHEPVGLDGSARFAAMARDYSGCEVLEQDFLRLDLPAGRFDGVFANAALFHVPSSGAARGCWASCTRR